MNKEQYNLQQKLDPIWRMGDRDEMSIKHIGHALAALVAFGDWRKGADYEYPIYYGDNGWTELQLKNAYRNLNERLDTRWAKVAALREQWGADKFRENAAATNYGFLMESYLESSWLGYAEAVA